MKLCISTRLFNIYSARLKICLFTEISINKRDYLLILNNYELTNTLRIQPPNFKHEGTWLYL